MRVSKILGINVANARKRQGLTKTQLCLVANISRPLLDLIEKGESNIMLENLDRVAKALDTEPWQLLKP